MLLRVRLLGPLEVERDGENIPLPEGRLRALIAALALHAAHPVPTWKIAERLWCDDPPPAAYTTLRGHVKRLRRLLDVPGSRSVITAGRQNYRLDIEPRNVDVNEFRSLLKSASPRMALALWRGPALSDVPSESLHREVVPELHAQHLDLLERRIEEDLRDGLLEDSIAELRYLVSSNPLREGLWAQLMWTLHAAGRPAEALATYESCRKALADHLGVDPVDRLRELHRRILLTSTAG